MENAPESVSHLEVLPDGTVKPQEHLSGHSSGKRQKSMSNVSVDLERSSPFKRQKNSRNIVLVSDFFSISFIQKRIYCH